MRSSTAMTWAWNSLQPDSPRERWPLCTMALAGCLWISFRRHLDVFSKLAAPKEHHGTSGFVWNSVTKIKMLFNICDQRCTLLGAKQTAITSGAEISVQVPDFQARVPHICPTHGGFYKWGYPETIRFKMISIINHPFWGNPQFMETTTWPLWG